MEGKTGDDAPPYVGDFWLAYFSSKAPPLNWRSTDTKDASTRQHYHAKKELRWANGSIYSYAQMYFARLKGRGRMTGDGTEKRRCSKIEWLHSKKVYFRLYGAFWIAKKETQLIDKWLEQKRARQKSATYRDASLAGFSFYKRYPSLLKMLSLSEKEIFIYCRLIDAVNGIWYCKQSIVKVD